MEQVIAMHQFLTLLIAAQLWSPAFLSSTQDVGPEPLFTQNMDGTGKPADWEQISTPNWDLAGGAYGFSGDCCYITPGQGIYRDFGNRTDVTAYFEFYPSAVPSATGYIIRISANGSTTYDYSFWFNSGSGTVTTKIGGTDASTSGLTGATRYYVKVRAHQGGGADAKLSIEFSADGVFDDVDDGNYAECSNGNKTTALGRITLMPGTGSTYTLLCDEIDVYDGWLAY